MKVTRNAFSVTLALPIIFGGGLMIAAPAQAETVCVTVPNGAQDCYDNGAGGGHGVGGSSTGNGGAGSYGTVPPPPPQVNIPAPQPVAPAPVAPKPVAPAPIQPAPSIQIPAPVQNYAPSAPGSGSASSGGVNQGVAPPAAVSDTPVGAISPVIPKSEVAKDSETDATTAPAASEKPIEGITSIPTDASKKLSSASASPSASSSATPTQNSSLDASLASDSENSSKSMPGILIGLGALLVALLTLCIITIKRNRSASRR